MAESAESKSIKQLTKTIESDNKKRNEQLSKDANREVISQDLIRMLVRQSKGEGKTAERAQKKLDEALDDIQTKAEAEHQIKKQEESNIIQKKLLGVNDKTLEKIQNNAAAMEEQKSIMAAQRKELEDLGIDADQDDDFKKEQIKLAKYELAQAKLTGSKDAEKAAKEKIGDKNMLGYLKKTAGFLGGIAKQGMEKVKSGLKGFSKFAFGALAIAALSFLNSPQFDKYYDQIVNVIVPALTKLYDEVIKPLAIYIGGKLKKAFKDIKEVIDGKKGILEFILENKVVVAGIAAALAPKGMFSVLAKGVGLMGTGIKKAWGLKSVQAFLSGPGGKLFGVAALAGGLAMAFKDGFDGHAKSKEWGVDKFSATIGGALAGTKSGLKGATEQATKWAAILGGAGMLIFPPIGAVIGGALGLVIGGILGYFGGEKIAKGIDNMTKKLGEAWETLTSFFSDKIGAMFDGVKKFFGIEVKETPESLAREERNRKRDISSKFSQDEKRLNQRIELAKREVDSTSVAFGFGTESEKKQEADRKKLESLQKELAARELEFKKQMGNTTVVDAKSINASNNSSNMQTGSTPLRNNHPMTRLIENAH